MNLSSHPPKRLREIDSIEGSKRRKEEARNELESYLYKLRDLLGDESETPFRKCSQPGERTAIHTKLEDTLAWMHDGADDADTSHFLNKISDLEYVFVETFRGISHSPFDCDVQEPRAPNRSQVQGNRGVPQSSQQLPNVELVFATIHHRCKEESYC